MIKFGDILSRFHEDSLFVVDIPEARSLLIEGLRFLEPSMRRITYLQFFASIESYYKIGEERGLSLAYNAADNRGISLEPVGVLELSLFPYYDIKLEEALSELDDCLLLDTLQPGQFRDVLCQVRVYQEWAAMNSSIPGQDFSINDYFASGLRVHVPDGEINYDPSVGDALSYATNVVFEQIADWLKETTKH